MQSIGYGKHALYELDRWESNRFDSDRRLHGITAVQRGFTSSVTGSDPSQDRALWTILGIHGMFDALRQRVAPRGPAYPNVWCFGRCSGTLEAADTPDFAEPDMRSDQMDRRHLVAAAAVFLGVLAVAGCTSMGAKDQAVIDRLEELDILAIPAGATKMSSTQTKGGGSDVVAIRGASSVLVVYASPLPAARITEFYQQTYDKTWRLKISAAAGLRTGVWRGTGANRSDPQTNVEIRGVLLP
jgi:hypothetical protein